MKNLFLTLLFISLISLSFSQTSVFGDSEEKEGYVNTAVEYNNTMIIAGRSFETRRHQNNVMCVDTSGAILWNTATSDPAINPTMTGGMQNIILGQDNFVYASGKGETAAEVWKVNPDDGTIVWKKLLTQVYTSKIEKVLDYDATRVLISYSTAYNSTVYSKKIALVNKSDGSYVEYAIGEFHWQTNYYDMVIDGIGNIYHTKADTLVKLNAANLNTSAYRQRISNGSLSYFSALNYDATTNSLIGVARHNSANSIFKLDADNGSIITENFYGVFSDYEVDKPTVKNGKIYYTLDYFSVMKYDIALGASEWIVSHDWWPVSGYVEAVSADTDDDGNVFATGYFGYTANNDMMSWGIIKISSNGVLQYSQSIDQNPEISNQNFGKIVCVIDNKPCFAGLFEPTFDNGERIPFFARINNLTGEVERKASLGGQATRFSSDAICSSGYINDKTLLLRQEGRVPVLECYDAASNLLWRKASSSDSKFYFGHSVTYAPNGDIFVVSSRSNLSYTSPFYSTSTYDSEITITKFNENGTSIGSWYFNDAAASSLKLIQTQHDGTRLLIVYKYNNTLRMRALEGNSLTSAMSTMMAYEDLKNAAPYTDTDQSTGYIMGRSAGQVYLSKVYKTGGVVSSSNQPYTYSFGSTSAYHVHSVEKLNSDELLISGKTLSSKDFLQRFNTTTNTNTWVYISAEISEVVKVIRDPDGNYVYMLSNTAGNIVVKKIDLDNGTLIWEYVYSASGISGLDKGTDITFHPAAGQILICGSQSLTDSYSPVSAVPVILKLSTDGMLIEQFIVPNEAVAVSSANDIHCLPNGKVWTVGNIYTNTYGKSGFVNEYMVCVADTTIISETACYLFNYEGTNYDTTGIYYFPFQNIDGCDSIVALDLTIVNIDSVTVAESACGSFEYEGTTYTSSGVYYVTLQNAAGCDSIVMLSLNVGGYEDTVNVHAANSYFWPQSTLTYTQSGTYYDTVTTVGYCDSIYTLNLDITQFTVNTFAEPSGLQGCTGNLHITAEENPSFTFDIGSSSLPIISSSGLATFNSLCPGQYSLQAIDGNNDTIHVPFVIPGETQFILTDLFSQTSAVDSIGSTVENCDIDFETIDTAYILSYTSGSNDTIFVEWAVVDASGTTIIPAVYILSAGNGSYYLQLQVYCSQKALGDYFAVTQSVFYEDGNLILLGMNEDQMNNIVMFPNPTSDNVIFVFDEPTIYIVLTDLNGKQMLAKNIYSGEYISLRNYSSGVYLFEVRTARGTIVRRIVKN